MKPASATVCNACIVLFFSAVLCAQSWAADEFATVKCDADIPSALVGKHAPNERVVVVEGLHKNIDLKDLGGIEISSRLSLVFWRICGSEYAELINTKKRLVRDVLRVPEHSLRAPQSVDFKCKLGGKELSDAVLAILDNSEGKKPKGYFEEIKLPAKVAWRIDEVQERFVSISTEQLSCALWGSNEDLKH